MSRESAPWTAGSGRRAPGRVAEAIGDLQTLAVGWRWDLTLDVLKSSVGTVAGTVKGEPDAPSLPTSWARTPFLVALRGLAHGSVLRPALRAEISLESHGGDLLPESAGTSLLVANHASHLDVGAVLATLPSSWRERTAIALTSDSFFQSWWKSGAAALAFNTFQLPESAPSAEGLTRFDVEPLREVLSAGWNVLVFPEGGRTRDGAVQPFQADVAAVAAQLRIPVVPVGIRGTFAALPQGTRWPRAGRPRVVVRYGAPVVAQPAESAEVLTARIHRGVADLIEEDTGTWWQVRRGRAHDDGDLAGARWRRIWQQSEEPTAGGRPRRRRIWRT